MSNWLRNNQYQLLLLLVSLVAIWPISFLQYTSKWDNLDCFLPYRYFVSFYWENGQWPFWNPFQHLGYPAYSDTQNGMYNPIVWIISLFGQYNSISLSIELTIYYILASLGMFKLSSLFVTQKKSQFLIALCYGLSGYFLGNSQILSFIAAAAFLPHILHHLLLYFKYIRWSDILLFSIYISLHLTTASPAYSIVLAYILLACFGAYFYHLITKKVLQFSWIKLSVGLITILLLSGAFLYSVWEFLPFMNRSEKLEYSDYLLQNPFDWHEYISFVFPYTTFSQSSWFGNTDLTMRSAYIGIIPLLFAIGSLKFIRELKIKLIWGGIILFLILAAGSHTPLYQYFYKLPGFGLFRHPALFRIYVVLFLTILAGISFERLNFSTNKKQKYLFLTIVAFFIVAIILAIQFRFTEDLKLFLSNWDKSTAPSYHHIRTLLLINLIVVLGALITAPLLKLFIKDHKTIILLLVLFDIGAYSQISGRYTIHLDTTQKDYSKFFSALPDTIDQSLATKKYKYLDENIDPKQKGLWRNTATFHKALSYKYANPTQFIGFNQIEESKGLSVTMENPLFYDINELVLLSDSTTPRTNLLWDWEGELPVINQNNLEINEVKILFNGFSAFVENKSPQADILILNQNYHSLWKAKYKSKTTKITLANQALMGVKIPAKSSGLVTYSFESPITIKLFQISVLMYLIVPLIVIFMKRKNLN